MSPLTDQIDAWFDHAPWYLTRPVQVVFLLIVLAMSPLMLNRRFRMWFMN